MLFTILYLNNGIFTNKDIQILSTVACLFVMLFQMVEISFLALKALSARSKECLGLAPVF